VTIMGSSDVPAFTLNPDRLFDADAGVRRIARELYEETSTLPSSARTATSIRRSSRRIAPSRSRPRS
jgi:hypothetical protein